MKKKNFISMHYFGQVEPYTKLTCCERMSAESNWPVAGMKTVEAELKFYEAYFDRRGSYRLVVAPTFTSLFTSFDPSGTVEGPAGCALLAPLLFSVGKKFGVIEQCTVCWSATCKTCCDAPCCDTCRARRSPGDLETDWATGTTTCHYCTGKAVPELANVVTADVFWGIVALIRTAFGFEKATCGYCSHVYLVKLGSAFKEAETLRNGKKMPLPHEFCWHCREKKKAQLLLATVECTYCHEYNEPHQAAKCDEGDCMVCFACADYCEECKRLGEATQCRYKKKCREPSSGKKRRINSAHKCAKCNIQQTNCWNSYGQAFGTKQCPHGWCHTCEKHPGEYHGCAHEF